MEKNVAGNIKPLWFYLTRNNCLALVLSKVEEANRTKKGMWKGVVVVPIVSWKTTRSGRLVVSREGQSKLYALMNNYWLLHGNQSKQGESLEADLVEPLFYAPELFHKLSYPEELRQKHIKLIARQSAINLEEALFQAM